MLVSLLRHKYVTRPQWANVDMYKAEIISMNFNFYNIVLFWNIKLISVFAQCIQFWVMYCIYIFKGQQWPSFHMNNKIINSHSHGAISIRIGHLISLGQTAIKMRRYYFCISDSYAWKNGLDVVKGPCIPQRECLLLLPRLSVVQCSK